MDNSAASLISAGVAKAKAQQVEDDSEVESDGSGDLLDSGDDDVSADEDSSEEDLPQLPVIPVRKQQYSRPRQRIKPPPKQSVRNFFKQKRKSDALKEFQKFSKRMKLDTGLTIKTIAGGDIVELEELLGEDSDDSYTRRDESFSSDGFSDPEFTIDPAAGLEPDQGNESFIDPETGDIIVPGQPKVISDKQSEPTCDTGDPKDSDIVGGQSDKTLSICDIINDSNELDLSKNVDIEDILGGNEFTIEKSAHFLENSRNAILAAQTGDDADYDITEKLKEMGEISVKSVKRDDEIDTEPPLENGQKAGEAAVPGETDEDKNKSMNNALNVRRNIREVMDEKQLDASTLAAQRQESERLARVQEQQRIIREVRRQISLGKQERAQARVVSMLAGSGSSLLKRSSASSHSPHSSHSVSGHKLNLPNTVMVKLPSGEMKKTTLKPGQLELLKAQRSKGNLTPSVSISPVSKVGKGIGEMVKGVRKDVVEIVDSSSSSSSSESPSSESDDCIMLSDSELPPSPEPEEDPQNSGLHVNDTYNIPDDQGRVVINFGHSEGEEDIFLAPQIGRIIKPHQIGGVRFLFDNIIESVERFSTSTGFGCILAHSMGLGKTLQIVCFCDIFLRHTKSKTVLCIMPINTLQNWVAEFNMWLPLDPLSSPLNAHGEVRPRNFPIYVLNDSHKTLQARGKVIHDWTETGGVLMIGYELYRLLSMKKNKKPRNRKKKNDPPEKGKDKSNENSKDKTDAEKLSGEGVDKKEGNESISDGTKIENKLGADGEVLKEGDPNIKEEKKEEDDETDEDKKLLNEMHDALVKPGPDLVICDEGHRIKNSHSNISYALKQMRTKRRVVLTGYPLQNNLLEYWCMVDFVRPNYLGTKTEFSNMFERPIQNGQCIDSTPQDIRLMRYRAHVLHSLLVGFVQRRSHAVLQTTLPQKEEYVLLVRMTDLQRKLYDTFMNEVVRKKTVPNPLKAFAVCCKIWNHPDVLYYFLKKRNEMAALIDYDLDIEDNPNLIKGAMNNQPTPINKKGKRTTRSTAKKDKSANSGKPAATIPPNTGSAPNDYHNPYDPSKSEHPNGPHNYGYGGEVPPNNYPPYQGYHHQYPPQNNYYGQNDSYGQQPYNSGYYQNQPYGADYNNQYNAQNPHMAPADGSVPPPQQQNVHNYPQNHGYNPQGYWGPDNNYYNNPDPNYYPPQNPPNYQSTQDPYSAMYDPYAQQTQPYHGFNQNRTNGDDIDPGFGNAVQGSNGTPYQQPTEPLPTSFNNPSNSDGSIDNVYNSGLYPPYQAADAASTEQDTKSSIDGVSSLLWSGGLDEPIKNEPVDRPVPNLHLLDVKNESKADSDGEIKIADLDTMKLINDTKPEVKQEVKVEPESKVEEVKPEMEPPAEKESEDLKKVEKVIAKKNGGSKLADSKTKEKPDKSKSKKAKDRSKAKDKKNGKRNSKDKSKNKGDDSGKESEKDEDSDSKKVDVKEEVPFEWANDILKGYLPGIIENSAKMEILFCVLEESIRLGDRLLLFSQSLFTLNLIEDFLQRNYITGTDCLWARNRSYYRLDGSTSALEREKLINEFNSNPNIHLFLVSTRAGSLGINLVGANRVIVFDASWNPCHDTQAVCRVYRYGQKKPCFVYRLVMDCCLEKKIYDRQINKQGMADRVVDECNPDAVLSMKEVTNLCWDNDEKESDVKDFKKDCKEKYLDVIMRKVIEEHARTLSKEPFQHESLLVDRKEKKLSSAEKRLAQRGYELEKKAASNPKPSLMYRTIRTADGSLIQRPVASVRPMQHGGSGGARWIPAEVWQRQGMTAQEMTLPLDVVIPTNSSDKSNIVLKAGQKVMVLKSPKGIYMQLETGKIIAIKTSFKVGQNKNSDGPKEGVLSKKISPSRPSNASLPGSLKNNSAITVISKSARGGMQKTMTRPNIIQNKIRGYVPGQIVRGVSSNIQNRGFSIIRGTRPVRPVPVQNKVNIKIQGAALNTLPDNKDRPKEILPKKIELVGPAAEINSVSDNSMLSTEGEAENAVPKSEQDNSEPSGQDDFGNTSGALRPNQPEDLASEDSSQEKTYADLSDRGESKITTQPGVRRPPVRPPGPAGSGSILKDCKIPIKNSYLHTDPTEIGYMNQVTIKRTTVPAAADTLIHATPSPRPSSLSGPPVISLLADETFPSEAALSERRLPPILDAVLPLTDDNSNEEDVGFAERKVYKPNLVERKGKINSLKNYRHPKMMTKPMAGRPGEAGSGASSPASAPTPPPVSVSAVSPLGVSKTPPEKAESSLARLEKTASSISGTRPGGVSDFRQTLSDITRTYSPDPDAGPVDKVPYRPGPKSRKKKNPPVRRPESPSDRLTQSISTPDAASSESGPAVDIPGPSRSLPVSGGPEVSGYVASHAGYGPTRDSAAPIAGGFDDPAYRQQNPSIDPAAPPQQPYPAYSGYPPAGGAYPAYPPAAPYYQPYPPAPYPPYQPQYPPAHPPAPYPPANYPPPDPNAPPAPHPGPYPGYPPYHNPNQW